MNKIKDAINGAIAPGCEISYVRVADVKSEPINWLWEGRIARGKITILAGDPGLGKSQITAFMASVVTNGEFWPIEKTLAPKGNVVILSAEDDTSDTIRPRLEAVGADLHKIYVVDAVKDLNVGDMRDGRGLDLRQDINRLEKFIAEIGGAVLIIIDPISAYLGGTDSHKNADVRALLTPLSLMAAKYEVAVLGVTHLNKGETKQALQRVTGSLAFVAAARAAYLLAKDNGNPDRRLLVPIKNNIGTDKTGFAFSVVPATLADGIKTSKIVFEDALVNDTADNILSSNKNSKKRSPLDEAKDFLIDICAVEIQVEEVKRRAEVAGISEKTLERAKKSLGIVSKKVGLNGGWVWKLPREHSHES